MRWINRKGLCFGIYIWSHGTGFVKLTACSYWFLDAQTVYTQYVNSVVLLYLGILGLFNGFGWLLVGRIFGLGARFGVYEILSAFYKGNSQVFL